MNIWPRPTAISYQLISFEYLPIGIFNIYPISSSTHIPVNKCIKLLLPKISIIHLYTVSSILIVFDFY